MPEISYAGEDDVEIIRNLAHAIWPVAYGDILSKQQLAYMLGLIYSEESLLNQIREKEHQFILVKENNCYVGFASYSVKSKDEPQIFRLHKLYVLPSQQRKGTGKVLLEFIVNEISKQAAAILELNVNRNNNALHFYNKMGFTISREEDIDIGEGFFMNDYVMELKVFNYTNSHQTNWWVSLIIPITKTL